MFKEHFNLALFYLRVNLIAFWLMAIASQKTTNSKQQIPNHKSQITNHESRITNHE
jgi:uncharacterized membrane protein YsdA (DUF1294 family)